MNYSESNVSATSDMTSLGSGLKYISASVYVVIIILALIGNLLACFAFVASGIVRMSPTNHFIFSLALSDLLTACFSMPFDLEQLLTNQSWPHGEVLCQVWTSTYLITVPTSIWSLLAVSVDRYKSLKDPLDRFRQTPFMTRRRAGLVIFSLWIYSGLFALMPVMGWKRLPRSVENNRCEFNITAEYSLLSSTVNFVLPTLFMCALYWRIYKIASGMTKGGALNPDENSNSSHVGRNSVRSLKKRIKTTKNILFVAFAFFFCWMPHTIFSMVTTVMFMTKCISCLYAIPGELNIILLMLGYLSSALNPYLYALRNKKFRNAFASVVPCLRHKFVQRYPSSRTSGNPQSSSLLRNQSRQSTATRTTTL